MGTINIQIPESGASLEELANIVAMLAKELAYVLDGNLDLSNLRANSVTADRIKAGTITADRMKVTQLSAIAADLGTITAGIIYGALIATANGTYPRVELSSVGNLLAAYFDATHYVSIIPNLSGTPAYKLTTPTVSGYLAVGSAITLQATGELDLGATTELVLQAGNFIHIIGGWGAVKNETTARTLQADLDAKANKGLAGTKIYYVSDTSGGVANRKLTFTDGVLTAEI